jgi:hypothetical protein
MNNYSLVDLLVLWFMVIQLFGLPLRAERDKRVRLHDEQSSFDGSVSTKDEVSPHPSPLLKEREQRTRLACLRV